jgi:branched-chain amino acid transport system permease protein
MAWPHLQVLFNGWLLGSLYGCAAMGFQLISGATGRVHLAFGHVALFSGLAGAVAAASTPLPYAVVTAALGLAAAAAGGLIHPPRLWRHGAASAGERARAFLLLGLGAALVLEDVGRRLWPLPATSLGRAGQALRWGGLAVAPARLAALAAALGLVSGLTLWLHRSRWGRAMRAWEGGSGPVGLMGIDPVRLGRGAMALGLGIAGLAGGMLGATQVVAIEEGMALTVRCLGLAVLGGTLSPGRVLGSGWLLGVWEAWVGQLWGAQWSSALGYGLLLLLLPLRARGRRA